MLPLFAEAGGADRPEMPCRRRLLRHQPAQRSQSGLDIGRRLRRHARHDQSLRQARVVVGKPFLEPHPVRRLDRRQNGHQPVGKRMPDLCGVEIIGSHGAIGVQTQQRERPGARRAKGLRGRQRLGEQGGRPPAPRRAGIAARAFAQRPKRPPVAVFRPAVLKPAAVEAHEVAKSPGVGIPGMLHESGEAGRQDFRQPLFAGILRAQASSNARALSSTQ